MPNKGRNVSDNTRATAESFNRTGIDFVFTELDVAITFCRESLSSRDPSRSMRAVGNARRAFREALRKRKKFVFSEVQKRDLVERVVQLKTLLREVARRKLTHTP
jgi:23S rRNA U2552 (ribose-2'-O)-methylase RlmE/FtsJ